MNLERRVLLNLDRRVLLNLDRRVLLNLDRRVLLNLDRRLLLNLDRRVLLNLDRRLLLNLDRRVLLNQRAFLARTGVRHQWSRCYRRWLNHSALLHCSTPRCFAMILLLEHPHHSDLLNRCLQRC